MEGKWGGSRTGEEREEGDIEEGRETGDGESRVDGEKEGEI